jgi:predicted AlkP superfamily phosphohydrolase/phosphomutase
MRRVIVIGLDGATWNLIKPWVDKGKLPTLKKLKHGGVWGELKSTIPPVTGSSWVSFATGMNPGKTGVFDFLIRRKGSYSLKPISSEVIRGIAFWDILSDQGIKVGILNFPLLCPPYKVNGFMISGIGCPKQGEITFPTHLKREIDDVTGGYEIMVGYHHKKYDDEDLFLRDANRVLDKRGKVIRYLMKNKSLDVFVVIFSCTDWIQHLMWKHIDSSHPLHDINRSQKYSLKFLEFWKKIDHIIGDIMDTAGNDANVFIVSDHGFGPQYGCFNLNRWLEKKGYLVRKRIGKRYLVRGTLKKMFRPLFTALAKASFAKIMRAKPVEKSHVVEQIDFEKSTAYTLGHTIPFGAIYLNVKGRDPNGSIDTGREYETLKAKIIGQLMNLRRDIGRDLEVKIFDPQETYWGHKVDEAPDVIFTINNWRCVIVENFSDFLYKDAPYSNRHTGSHRVNGIFLAYGPEIKKGRIKGANILDIAPTILHLLNVPIPENIDGRILKEIFKETTEPAKREPRYLKTSHLEKQTISKIKKLKRASKI